MCFQAYISDISFILLGEHRWKGLFMFVNLEEIIFLKLKYMQFLILTFQRKSQIVRLKREMGSKSDNNILGIIFEILKYFEAGSLICPTHTFLNAYLRLSENHVLKC